MYQLAQSQIRQALQLAPEHIEAVLLSGKLFGILEDRKKALAHLKHAEKLIERIAGLAASERLVLAENYITLGEFNAADTQVKRIINAPDLNPALADDRLIAAQAFIVGAIEAVGEIRTVG